MIDSKQSTYSGELSHYSVTLALKEKNLEIKVLDNEVLQKFHAKIDRAFIDEQDMLFTALFETPEDVFIYLTEYFSQVVIGKGVLRFSYTLGKKLRIKEIELAREEVEENGLVFLQIKKIKEHFATQLRHKENRIVALEQGLTELVNQFREYKKESQEKMRWTDGNLQKEQIYSKGLEEKIRTQENTIKILEDRLQREEKITKDLGERMQMQEKNSKSMEEKLHREKKSSKGTEEKMSQIVPISHHPSNSHQQYYTLSNFTANSAKLVRVGGGSSNYNFVNKTELLPNKYCKYAVKIIMATNSYLMIGFCTDNGLGNKDNYGDAESAYYFCWNTDSMWEGGVCKDLYGCGSGDGELVECLAEWPERLIWSKDGKVLAECAVPAAMKGKPAYFSILLAYEGDEVEVSSVE